MKKNIKTRQLGRDSQARKALLCGLVKSMLAHGEIKTTSAKARAVRTVLEKLITKGKLGSLHARRQIMSYVNDKILVKKLVDEIIPLYKDVRGGYTRLTAVGNRRGDAASIVKLALTKQLAAAPKHSGKKAGKKPSSKSVPAPVLPPSPPAKKTGKIVQSALKVAGRVGKRGDR